MEVYGVLTNMWIISPGRGSRAGRQEGSFFISSDPAAAAVRRAGVPGVRHS